MDDSALPPAEFLQKYLDLISTDPSMSRDSRLISRLMAVMLTLLDSSTIHEKMEGIRYVAGYLDRIPLNLLKKYGCLDVLFDALQRLLTSRDHEIINEGYSLIIRIIGLTKDEESAGEKLRKSDQILLQTLTQIDLFSDYATKRCLCQQLLDLTGNIGFSAGKFYPRYLAVAETFGNSLNVDMQTAALEMLSTCLQEFSVLSLNHRHQIVLIALKVILVQRKALSEDDRIVLLAKKIFSNLDYLEKGFAATFAGNVMEKQVFDEHFTGNVDLLF